MSVNDVSMMSANFACDAKHSSVGALPGSEVCGHVSAREPHDLIRGRGARKNAVAPVQKPPQQPPRSCTGVVVHVLQYVQHLPQAICLIMT